MYKNKVLLLLNNIKNLINENHNIRNIIMGVVALIIYSIVTRDYTIYLLLNNIITIVMFVVFIYVNAIRSKYVDKTFMKGFELTYIMSLIIIILNLVGFIFLFEDISESYFVFLFSVQATLECCQIENSLKVKNNTLKNIIICISYCILLAALFYVLKFNNWLSNDYRFLFFISSVAVSVMISIVTCILTLKNIKRTSKEFSANEYKKIIFYMLSIFIYYIGLLCLILGNEDAAKVLVFVKCFAFYNFYNYIISKMLDNSLVKINENIETATKTKRELNSILKKRNTILNEANIMLQKTQDKNNQLVDSIYGGVFLFYNDKLQYINKRTLGTFDIENNETLEMELSEFIKRYFHITLEDIKTAQNYIPFAKMKYTELDVEIFLINIDEKSKILYIHDISEINENKMIKKVLQEYLEEEQIKKEFFANISHELKTPINLIFAAIQVNQIYLDENNIEGIDKNRKIISQNCLRLIRTINNFIDANKVSEGYMIPDYKVHNMVDIVENAAIACNKYIELFENTLTFDADEEEIYVKCDKEMITRIILNILSNSVKYGKKGGNINVSVGIYRGYNVSVKVRNDGMQIDKETIPYIFDRFTKLNKAFNRLREGSGLGLFLTKALIELQGGSISLISRNSGNEFIIVMPRVVQPSENEFNYENWEPNPLEEKIEVEFSDIYID